MQSLIDRLDALKNGAKPHDVRTGISEDIFVNCGIEACLMFRQAFTKLERQGKETFIPGRWGPERRALAGSMSDYLSIVVSTKQTGDGNG
jgi:hypothetical protein